MRLIIKQLAVIGFLIAGLSSCQLDETISLTDNGGVITIGLSVPGNEEKDYVTYAMPADESTIENVAVLVFKTDTDDPTNVTKGTFLYRAAASYSRPDPSECILTIKQMDEAQTFVFIANAIEAVNNTSIAVGEDKADVLRKLLLNKSTAFDAATMTSIPMWGEVQNVTVNDGVFPTGLSCKFYRMLAKINVSVNANIPETDFLLKSVRLYMPRQKGTLIPDNWGAYTSMGETMPPDEAVSTPTEPAGAVPARKTNYTYTASANKVENIYSFESLNDTDPSLDPLDRTCLVVGGWYKNDTSREYYYRIDLRSGDTQLNILRNFIYNVTISDVGGKGVENPDDAYSGLSSIDASIESWNRVDGDVRVVGDHLYVSNRYPWRKINGSEVHSGSASLIVKTTDPDGWQWDEEDEETQTTLATFRVASTGGASNTMVDVSWTPDDITVSDPTGRSGKAVIISGNQKFTVYFMQDDCGRLNVPLSQTIGENVYKTHRYGTDCWMVENSMEGSNKTEQPETEYRTNGSYYNWTMAMQSNNACPSGWSLPDNDKWEILRDELNNDNSFWWVKVEGNAFAGYITSGLMHWRAQGAWWSSSVSSESEIKSCFFLSKIDEGVIGIGEDLNTYSLSVRCVKN